MVLLNRSWALRWELPVLRQNTMLTDKPPFGNSRGHRQRGILLAAWIPHVPCIRRDPSGIS